ncbi:DUF3892 domain-containing protein [Pedobacter sandarakinus]|uniref:DUF3892 domain-containing protein n=1 Tax=Pedobacter sandarakinus TaxID=353156 RepID=UPI002247B1FA|nr:DUF3892 domain-containing protein [Pedobacter sandarakinus]MCX2575070.1 DUF3892 domain-containing protein [Pedobacter sandarakinus]
MAKTAHYFITGVWKDTAGNITNLYIHNVNEGDSFDIGVKKSKYDVIALIEKGYIFYTITWGYPTWKLGAKVEVISRNSIKYLRSNADSTSKDNLDNLISMTPFNV